MYCNGLWKAKWTLLLSLFVFVSYNNDISASPNEAVKTELLISKNDRNSDVFFSLELTDNGAPKLPNLPFEGFYNLQYNLDCFHAALLVKVQLDLFIAFCDQVNLIWRITSHSSANTKAVLAII